MLGSTTMKQLLLILSVSFALLGCAETTSEAHESTPVAGYPRTVKVFEDRELTLQRPIERIIPANTAAMEILADLGAFDSVLAVPEPAFAYSGHPLERTDWEGRTFERYLVEPMLAFEPDFVITHAWQNPETSGFLEENGVAVLDIPIPLSLDDLLEGIRATARVLELDERAEELCASLTARREALANSPHSELRLMTYASFGTGSWTAAKNTTADLFIRFAGLRNASAEHGLEGHAAIDVEMLLEIDPDYLLVGSSQEDPQWSATLDVLRNDESLKTLRAIREDRILVIPLAHYTANSHYLIDAAEGLAAQVAERERN